MSIVKSDIVVRAASTYAAGGAAEFNLIVDGSVVARNVVANADFSAGQWSNIPLSVDLSTSAKSIEIRFVNDMWVNNGQEDRNLFIDGMSINGVDFTPRQAQTNNAYYHHGVSAIYADGSISYDIANRTDIFADAGGPNPPAVNAVPIALNDRITLDEDTSATFNPRANDSDPDGDALTISNLGSPLHGSAVLNANGTITYTPDADYYGSDRINYTVSDGRGGTDTARVNITVLDVAETTTPPPTNRAPVATNDQVSVTEDNSVTFNARANDSDPDGDGLTVSNLSAPAHGTAVLNANGTITYTPTANYNGADSFTYRLNDGRGGTDTGQVNITVLDDNDPADNPTPPPSGGGGNQIPSTGNVYYVSKSGSNSSDGSASSPWLTIGHAMNQNLRPGDTVVVKPGTYNEQVTINQGGTSGNYVTLMSESDGQALIRTPSSGWNGISINADYVTVKGFDIRSNGGGDGIEGNNVHHINILDNIVHDNGESGIQFNWSEFLVVDGNVTYGNASDGWFSGISIYQNRNISGDRSTGGYRTEVTNNISYDNVTYGGAHTDGNGIIIDDFQSTQTSGYPNYTFPTLVSNNLTYNNGGKGIQVTWSDHVTVSNNTSWHNNLDNANSGTWRGELSNAQSSNNTWINNIAVADPSVNSNNTAIDNNSYGGYTNSNVVWNGNLTYNGRAGQASYKTDGGNGAPGANLNLLGVDPQFVNAGAGDFRLAANSPAINAGTSHSSIGSEDLAGHSRVSGGTVDLGAYEYGSSASGTSSLTTLASGSGSTSSSTQSGSSSSGTTINGTSAKDVLQGTNGDDIIHGRGGADTIDGRDGDDLIHGGNGGDTITGGRGADLFLYQYLSEGGDTVTDFNYSEGDKLDVTALLKNFDPANDRLDDFVKVQEINGDTHVSIDIDGTGSIQAQPLVVLEHLTGHAAADLIM
jgi:hypothetical protein